MSGIDPESRCVRFLNVRYLDSGIVREFWSKGEGDGYVGRGFRFGDQWWIEPGTIVILETDGGTGPVTPAPNPGLCLALYVHDGQMVGIVSAEDGIVLTLGELVAFCTETPVQEAT